MKKKAIVFTSIAAVLVLLIVAAAVLVMLKPQKFFFSKEDCVQAFVTPKNQTVVTVGTIHGNHFDKSYSYPISDLESLVKYVKPDYIFIEARQKTFEQYNVVDGPVEMIYLYCYGKEHNIPVRFVDWWEVNNDSRPNTTTDERDDHIFENICANLEDIKAGKKVMVFYGTKHFHEQMPRMKNAGWQFADYGNKNGYYYYSKKPFAFPESLPSEIQKKIEYYRTAQMDEIKANITDKDALDIYTKQIDSLIVDLQEKILLVKENKIFE